MEDAPTAMPSCLYGVPLPERVSDDPADGYVPFEPVVHVDTTIPQTFVYVCTLMSVYARLGGNICLGPLMYAMWKHGDVSFDHILRKDVVSQTVRPMDTTVADDAVPTLYVLIRSCDDSSLFKYRNYVRVLRERGGLFSFIILAEIDHYVETKIIFEKS